MSWSVDDIDFCIFVMNGRIFGKDRDPTFPFDVVGVHDTLLDLLIFTENAALL